MNLAGGLLIGAAAITLGYLKRLSSGAMAILASVYLASVFVYLYGYHRVGTDLAPLSELSRAKDLLVYVLTYFGASWTLLLPHKERIVAFVSIALFLALFFRLLRERDNVSDLEWFLIGECGFTLAIALLTAMGRLQFGVGQAFASRYQTPAMIYWAALASLLVLWLQRNWPKRIIIVQAFFAAVMLLSILTFPRLWAKTTLHADVLRTACAQVMGPYFDVGAASKLYENTSVVEKGRTFLRRRWSVPIATR